MIKIFRYSPLNKKEWNDFNSKAKNGLFLFDRNYLEYHQDRFEDHSLMIYDEEQLLALFPMNVKGNEAFSHSGLTFGSLIIKERIYINTYLHVFESLINYLRINKFVSLIYKAIPFIFHKILALEDNYALYRCGANLIQRNMTSCIDLQGKIHYSKGRKYSLKQALKSNLKIHESLDFQEFMKLVDSILQDKYGVKPTHTAEELKYLATIFPSNIKLLAAFFDCRIVGGCVVYLSEQVVHLQYIATNDLGKELHALDFLIYHLIQTFHKEKKYINFGISPGSDAFDLNAGLIQNKQSYGAHSLPQDIYRITI
ncbi:hypothetical protein [Adhaeribacter aquaticus]|uniref:hypothetical protein n=1 Tax=Adhaeribacter aquaticus TaxID=299567 RepID=UPI00041A2EAA|nr:hypothetical protein [Adhaeribacter aquaticus]